MTDHTFRQQFTAVAAKWAFLDHAAVAPLPAAAVAALHDYGVSLMQNGIAAVGRWAERMNEVRRLSARLVNAPPADVCLVPSTSYGVGIVAEGYPWTPGDNVVLPADEYPSNVYPWLNLDGRGVSVRRVPSVGGRVLVDELRAAMDSRTRVLAVSAVEFATGFRNDLALLGQLCRERGVFFFVDAIQQLGAIPLDVQALGIDALSADGHKWMLGPEGAGLAYLRGEWADRFRPVMVGWNSVARPLDFHVIDFTLKPGVQRWEGGAPNVPGVTAFGASLQLILDYGVENVWRRVEALTDHVCDRAAAAGLRVFSSRAAGEKSGIVSFESDEPAVEVMKRCRATGVVVNARAGRVRVSPHGYNTADEIDRFLAAVRGD